MGQGVRQGCGLSPLLWLAYTVLIFDRLSEYMPVSSTTGFADDFHLAWRFHRTFEFRNACAQLPRVLQDLRDLGMEVIYGEDGCLTSAHWPRCTLHLA